MPFWGTCMGMIVAAHDVADMQQRHARICSTSRCGATPSAGRSPRPKWTSTFPALGPQPFPAVFIRAPWVERAGPGVEVLAARDGHGVFVRQGNVIGTVVPSRTDRRRPAAPLLRLRWSRNAVSTPEYFAPQAPNRRRMSTAPDALAAPPIDALVGEMIATLALAANAYLEPKDGPPTSTPRPWRATSPGLAFERIAPRLRADERTGLAALLTQIRLSIVKKRG